MTAESDPGGFLLSLVTESFAVRALLGSLAAAALAAVLVGVGVLRTRRARRIAVLAPVLTAAVAAVASVGEAYLPQLWFATGAGVTGSLLEAFGEQRGLVTDRRIDVLVVAYALVLVVLGARRVLGAVAVRRTVRRGILVEPDRPLAREVARLADGLGLRPPTVRLVEACPGGAFTTGGRRAVVAIDPALLAGLDEMEREGLLAHELAHIRRRDTTLALLVGVFRDLAFFLPPLHLAVRWFRREQEEGADELASTHTGRPVALASSILKAWNCSRDRRALAGVCAAAAHGRVALPSGVLVPGPAMGESLKTITARIERLIARAPSPGRLRQCTEAGLALAALAAGTAAALTVPPWIATTFETDSLSFGYLAAPPEVPVEAPALATFRALTPATSEDTSPSSAGSTSYAGTTVTSLSGAGSGCPCVESQAQLRRREPAQGAGAPTRLSWGSADRPPWQVRATYRDATVRTARPLVLLSDTGPRVGVFLVSAAER